VHRPARHRDGPSPGRSRGIPAPRGLTLIELITVVAIISVMVGIAVPVFVQSGAFARNDVEDAARDLHRMLLAARTYAATYHVDAAVVYTIARKTDSISDRDVFVLDGMAMARALRAGEIDHLVGRFRNSPDRDSALAAAALADAPRPVFVLVNGEEGKIRLFKNRCCVMYNPFNRLSQTNWLGEDTGEPNRYRRLNRDIGLVDILLFDVPLNPDEVGGELRRIAPRHGLDYGIHQDELFMSRPYTFPAHVFRPDGVLATSSPKLSFTVPVGPSPEAPEALRFREAPSGSDEEGLRFPYELIQLHATTGRAKFMGREKLREENPA